MTLETVADELRAAPVKRNAGVETEKGLLAVARRFGHIYWYAGESDCPDDIKAPNGEIFKLRCKKCGEENPVSKWCPVESLPNVRANLPP